MRCEINTVGKFEFVSVNGQFESEADVKSVDGKICALIERGSRNFVFKLDNINYLDSAAAGIFISTLCYTQKQGGLVFMIAKNEDTRKVLEAAGFHYLIKIFVSEDEFLKIQGEMF